MFNITSYQILQLNVQFKKKTSSCLVHLYDLTHSCITVSDNSSEIQIYHNVIHAQLNRLELIFS